MRTKHRSTKRRGVALIYSVLLLLVLVALVAFAVDLGRMHLVKSQLQATADAAARAAAWRIPDQDMTGNNSTSGYSVAKAVAADNTADGSSVVLDTTKNDVVFGTWSLTNRTFTQATTAAQLVQANAVQVTTWRAAGRSTAVQHDFAPAIGGPASEDVSATAIAMIFGASRTSGHGFGIFGKISVTDNGNTLVDSYDPSAGPYGGANVGKNGGVSSDGQVSLVGNAEIDGDIRGGPEGSPYLDSGEVPVSAGSNTTVTGWEGRLDSMLSYPSVSAPTTYDNTGIQSMLGGKTTPQTLTLKGTVSIPGGTYYVGGITVNGNASVTFTGPVTFYVNGDVDLTGGSFVTSSTVPANFTINVMPGSGKSATSVKVAGGSALYAHIYAPDSDVTVNGTSNSAGVFGWIIGNSITIKGNSGVHYDGTNDGDGDPTHDKFAVQLVR